MSARWMVGDVWDRLAELPDGSVDLVLTSPPFLGLRSYLPADHPDKAKEIGSEPTPADYLDTLLALTEEWGRVLAPHGSICVELGDTYTGSGGAGGDYSDGGLREGQPQFKAARKTRTKAANTAYRLHPDGSIETPADRRASEAKNPSRVLPVNGGNGWPLDKSLAFIPQLYGASLAYGRNLLRPDHTFEPWRVRNFVAWVRPNPPVGALGDKVRPATSYLTWACRSKTRWFDLDAVRTDPDEVKDQRPRETNGPKQHANRSEVLTAGYARRIPSNPGGAPPLDWWQISPGGYQGAHYAVFPPELCRIPIEASCPRRVCRTCGKPSRRETVVTGMVDRDGREVEREVWASGIAEGKGAHSNKTTSGTTTTTTTGWTSCGCPGTDGIRLDGYHTGAGWRPGIVLDPFAGSGTTLAAATGRGRDAIGIDLDDRNLDLAYGRLGMFLDATQPVGGAA